MKLREIKIKELDEYLHSNEYAHTHVVPITPQRVTSQVQNPRADPEDIALILAEEENGNVLGFIGLLPDKIRTGQNKVFWISCWWVDSNKGKMLGVPLLLAAYKASKGCLLADSIPETLSVFEKSRLFHIPPAKQGIKLFLKPIITEILIRKKPTLRRYQTALKIVDGLSALLFAPFAHLRRVLHRLPNKVTVRKMTDEFPFLTLPIASYNLFQRGKEEIEWILKNPWMKKVNELPGAKIYPFSHLTSSFHNHLLFIHHSGEPSTVWLTEREGVVKMVYANIVASQEMVVSKAILAYLYTLRAKEFVTFDVRLVSRLKNMSIPFVYKHPTNYQYVWGKSLGNLPLDDLDYGDGDALFT